MTRTSSFTERRLVTNFIAHSKSLPHSFIQSINTSGAPAKQQTLSQEMKEHVRRPTSEFFMRFCSYPTLNPSSYFPPLNSKITTKSKGYNTQEIEEKVLKKNVQLSSRSKYFQMKFYLWESWLCYIPDHCSMERDSRENSIY